MSEAVSYRKAHERDRINLSLWMEEENLNKMRKTSSIIRTKHVTIRQSYYMDNI